MRSIDRTHDIKAIGYMLSMTVLMILVPSMILRALVAVFSLLVVARMENGNLRLGKVASVVLSSTLAFAMTLPFLLISEVRFSGLIPAPTLANILTFQVSVSMWEETIYRGYPLSRLTVFSLFSSSFFFSMIHIFNPGFGPAAFIGIFIAGLTLGLMRYYWGLLSAISFHATWNLALGHLWGFSLSGIQGASYFVSHPSGPDFLTGGTFGPEASVFTFTEFFALFLAMRMTYDR